MDSDIYRLVTVDNGKADTASIVKVFSDMAAGRLKCDIRLLNYYQEVPVTYPSTIRSVEVDSVELQVHEHQALIMKNDNSTLITGKHFHREFGVHCYAAYVSVPKKTVILHNFAYAQIRAARREAVRVKVLEAIPVMMAYEGGEAEGTLVDISGNGVSINSSVLPAVEADQWVLLSFTVMGVPLAVHGAFVKALSKGENGYICVFKMKLDRASDTIVGRFIYQRQIEIIQGLKDGLVEDS